MHLHKGPWLWLQGYLVLASLEPGCCHSTWLPPFHGWVTLRNWCPCPVHGTGVAWACGNLAMRKQRCGERRREKRKTKNNRKKGNQKTSTAEEKKTPNFSAGCLQNILCLCFQQLGHSFPSGLVGKPGCPETPLAQHTPVASTPCPWQWHHLLPAFPAPTGPPRQDWCHCCPELTCLLPGAQAASAHHSMQGHGRHEPWRLDLTVGLSVNSQLQNAIKEWKEIPNPHQIWRKKEMPSILDNYQDIQEDKRCNCNI